MLCVKARSLLALGATNAIRTGAASVVVGAASVVVGAASVVVGAGVDPPSSLPQELEMSTSANSAAISLMGFID
jgi:hypothetical protein